MRRPPTDLAYASLGWFLLAFPPVVSVARSVAPALAAGRTPFLLAGLFALPFAALHWLVGWSVGPLGALFFWSVALWVGVGLPAALLFDLLGVGVDPPPLAVVCVVYAVAGLLALRPGVLPPRDPPT